MQTIIKNDMIGNYNLHVSVGTRWIFRQWWFFLHHCRKRLLFELVVVLSCGGANWYNTLAGNSRTAALIELLLPNHLFSAAVWQVIGIGAALERQKWRVPSKEDKVPETMAWISACHWSLEAPNGAPNKARIRTPNKAAKEWRRILAKLEHCLSVIAPVVDVDVGVERWEEQVHFWPLSALKEERRRWPKTMIVIKLLTCYNNNHRNGRG